MFREIDLREDERDYHHFLRRNPDTQQLENWRMKRLTFGVTSIPIPCITGAQAGSRRLRRAPPQGRRGHSNDFLLRRLHHWRHHLEEAVSVCTELNSLLNCASMTLRKWRSNSTELLDTIPPDLKEAADIQTF